VNAYCIFVVVPVVNTESQLVRVSVRIYVHMYVCMYVYYYSVTARQTYT